MKLSVTYIGLRIIGETVYHCFRHGKQMLHYSKSRSVIIGSKYEAERKGESTMMSRAPKCVGKADVDESVLNEWRELNEMAEAHRAYKKAVSRAKNIETDIEKHLAPIKVKYRKYRSHEDRIAFERMVLRMLNR